MVRIPYFAALTDDQLFLLNRDELMNAYAELREHHVFETQELWRRLGDAKRRADDRITIDDLKEVAVLRGGDSLGITDDRESLDTLERMQKSGGPPEDDDLLGKPGGVRADE